MAKRKVGRKKFLTFKRQPQKVLHHALKNNFLYFYVLGMGLETNTGLKIVITEVSEQLCS